MGQSMELSAGQAAERLASIRGRMEKARRRFGPPPERVELVAVSKTFPAEAIEPFLAAGQRVFGENRVQEAKVKWPGLKAKYEGVELHLIGPLQTNKVREAVALFDVIETLDRDRLAAALAKEMAKQARSPTLYVQVNTGDEPQKAGIAPGEAAAFVARCRDELRLPVRGLMCIPPVDEEPSLHFALLTKMAARNGLSRVSMGMSHDFESAVTLGATHVRVGTAIFGARPPLGVGSADTGAAARN